MDIAAILIRVHSSFLQINSTMGETTAVQQPSGRLNNNNTVSNNTRGTTVCIDLVISSVSLLFVAIC
jgi:hypothetical protein